MTPHAWIANLVLALGLAQSASLPPDARLLPVRARLEELVARSTASGLPADLLVSKVREGLAKGAAPEQIEAVASRLLENLRTAQTFVLERRRAPGESGSSLRAEEVPVVRALAEARLAGVDLASADPMLRLGRPASATARAVEVLTDLSLRGYPAGRAAPLVRDLFDRDPAAVGRLPASLEVLRREQGLTHGETVDALARGLQRGGSLDQARARAAEESQRPAGTPVARGRSESAGGVPGGVVPPGQLKKQTGIKSPRPEHPDRGLGRTR